MMKKTFETAINYLGIIGVPAALIISVLVLSNPILKAENDTVESKNNESKEPIELSLEDNSPLNIVNADDTGNINTPITDDASSIQYNDNGIQSADDTTTISNVIADEPTYNDTTMSNTEENDPSETEIETQVLESPDAINDSYKDTTEITSPTIYDGAEAVKQLNNTHVSDNGGYSVLYGSNTLRVYAEERSNLFCLSMTGGLNLWSDGTSYTVFNCSQIDTLTFYAALEDGRKNNVEVKFFLDDNMEYPAHEITLVAGGMPQQVTLDLKEASSLRIVTENQAATEHNMAVFYDISLTMN